MDENRLMIGAGVVVLCSLFIALAFAGGGREAPPQTPAVAVAPSSALKDVISAALSTKYGRPESDLAVQVNASDGTFAKGTVNMYEERGGGVWFAVRVDGDWQLAYDGNGIMDCATAAKHLFPPALVPTCIDTVHDNALVERSSTSTDLKKG